MRTNRRKHRPNLINCGEHKALAGYRRDLKTDAAEHPAVTLAALEDFLRSGQAAQRAVERIIAQLRSTGRVR